MNQALGDMQTAMGPIFLSGGNLASTTAAMKNGVRGRQPRPPSCRRIDPDGF